MEIIKKKIRMDRTRIETQSQSTLENDLNLPENKPDVQSVLLSQGTVVFDEIRQGNDMVNVRGHLQVNVLYHTAQEGGRLVKLQSQLPFDEKIHISGVLPSDRVDAIAQTDDLSVGMINSRKLSVQAVMTFQASAQELYDEEIPVGAEGAQTFQYRMLSKDVARVVVHKNDVYRIREEISLPGGYPNIYQILWSHISLGEVRFQPRDGSVELRGDIQVFLLYETEGESHQVRTFETVLPLSGELDCGECREGDFADIRFAMGQQELTVRPDGDGEERCIGAELTLELKVCIYREEKEEILSDLYGVTKEIVCKSHTANLKKLLGSMTGKTRLEEQIPLKEGSAPILQMLHSEGEAMMQKVSVVSRGNPLPGETDLCQENSILIEGAVQVKNLYITGNDDTPYACLSFLLPYRYVMEMPEVTQKDIGEVQVRLEQLQVSAADGENVLVKSVLNFHVTALGEETCELISELEISDLSREKMSNLPGMAIYMVRPGDNLWSIGKKYYVTVDAIKEQNALTSDELRPGQKLLILK